jgi:ribosomal protein S18 acetylase RimI-like enzyme
MTVRSARTGDVGAVRGVVRRSWETDYEDVLTRETVDEAVNDWYAPERIEAELDRENAMLLVAERDGTVVGFAHATWTPDEARGHVLRLYVDPNRRRAGVGRELLERTCADLVDRGVERVDAMVLSANDPGTEFYEAFGFEFVDESETTIGDERYPESRYVLDPAAAGVA